MKSNRPRVGDVVCVRGCDIIEDGKIVIVIQTGKHVFSGQLLPFVRPDGSLKQFPAWRFDYGNIGYNLSEILRKLVIV